MNDALMKDYRDGIHKENVLTPLHEFVITVITYAKLVLPDGTVQTVPCRTIVKG